MDDVAWLARRVLIRVAFEEVAHEWLCTNGFDWPPDRSVRLELDDARWFPVGALVDFEGDGYEVFANDGEEVRVVPVAPEWRQERTRSHDRRVHLLELEGLRNLAAAR